MKSQESMRNWGTRIGHLTGSTRPIETEAAYIGSGGTQGSPPFIRTPASRTSWQKSTSLGREFVSLPAKSVARIDSQLLPYDGRLGKNTFARRPASGPCIRLNSLRHP